MKMNSSLSIRPPVIVSIIMLLIAMLPVPYGYYTLLRIVVCLSAGFLAWHSYKMQRQHWMWGLGFIALIFNPIIPLHLGREIWVVIDIVVAIVLGIYLIQTRAKAEEG